MRKLVLALAVAFCSFQSWSQSDCGELLDHDQDDIIGAEDLMNLLSFYGQPLAASAGPCDNLESVTFDGYEYDLVEIGDQCWFAENLRTEHYTNGDAIPANLSDGEWVATTSGAVAVYGEDVYCENYSPDGDACDPAWSLAQYGRLYNWYAVDDERGLCPTGWHVPSDGEWMTLEMELGMSEATANTMYERGSMVGTQMKTTYGWYNPVWATNCSGFSGLPGGMRYNGSFLHAGKYGFWWSASSNGNSNAWRRLLLYHSHGISRTYNDYRNGQSVRCLKDTTP